MIRADVVQRLALGSLDAVRSNPTFPYKTGHLKYAATYTDTSVPNQFTIVFDKLVAPYIKNLDGGTKRSTTHVGFIDRAREDVIGYLAIQFRAKGNYQVKRNNTRGYGR